MRADQVEYDAKQDVIVAKEGVFIQFKQYTINADYIYYDIKKDHLFAEGNIRVKDQDGKILHGERAIFKDELKVGLLSNFTLKIDDSILVGRIAKRIDENRFSLHQASFTPCKITCGKEPIWKISARDTYMDFENNKVYYRNVFFHIYGIKVAYTPYFAHPTPKAPAQTGFLIPELKHDSLLLPFYIRFSDSLDFTISPRFDKKYVIYEMELRQALKYGTYSINGSYGSPPFKTTKDNIVNKRNKRRFHIFSEGNFFTRNIHYGFNIKRTSDKAYLKNYFETFDSFLTSKFYVYKTDERDYFSMEGYHFQGLRAEDDKKKMPIVLPSTNVKKFIALDDDESKAIVIKNNTVFYNESYVKQVGRNSLEISGFKDLQLDSGHTLNFELSNRSDLYFTNIENNNKVNTESVLYRNIPETSVAWRYPLMAAFGDNKTIKLEPIIKGTTGKPFESRFQKFELIDVSKFDFDKENLFMPNKFNGKDLHEYGHRLNYGLNTSLLTDNYLLDSFVGQALHKNNFNKLNNAEFVGSFNLDLLNDFSSGYRFRKDENFRSIRDEIEVGFNNERWNFNSTIISLSNIAKYFSGENFALQENKIKQLNLGGGYKLTDNLSIGTYSIFDLSRSKKPRQLTRSIRVTYVKDCVSISGKISDDFTHDTKRGVNKVRSKSVSIGFKVINM